jgi:hypothetical protein
LHQQLLFSLTSFNVSQPVFPFSSCQSQIWLQARLFARPRFVFMLALFILPPVRIMWVFEDYTPRLIQGGLSQYPVVRPHFPYDPDDGGDRTKYDDDLQHQDPPDRSRTSLRKFSFEISLHSNSTALA